MRPSPRQHDMTERCSSLLVALLAFCAFVGLLSSGMTAQAHGHEHDHGHFHAEAGHQDAGPGRIAQAATETPAADSTHADGHGHQHSGDPLTDLLTLGHNHVGGPVSGLPPALWRLAAMPHASEILAAWPQRAPGYSPPENPFRPPIA